MKEKTNIVFVVLTYANTTDITDFLQSLCNIKTDYKVVIVNSFYNEYTLKECKKIAEDNNCLFLSVPNKGYSAGNNKGIEYANEHYDYNYLIISNPDILIKEFDYEVLENNRGKVIGPEIITSKGKRQNPFYVDKKIFPKQEYYFLKNKFKLGYFAIIAINKLKKQIFFTKMKWKNSNEERVYALHGSFIILSREALTKLGIVFDENMFLFCEEMVLAEEMKRKKIEAIYSNRLQVYHKEDGSMRFLKGSMYDEEVKSNGYVYNKYFRK